MIAKIDQWLIDNVYQRIVDWSQRDSQWWVRETAFFCMIYAVIRIVFKLTGFDIDLRSYVGVMVDGACAGIFWWWARDRMRIVELGTSNGFRRFVLVLAPTLIFIDLIVFPFNLPTDILFVSFYFFAACRPPRPREKKATKPKLAFNT